MKLKKFNNYISNLILIFFVILLYEKLPYYNNFLRGETKITIIILAIGYAVGGFLYYYALPFENVKKSKSLIFFNALKRIFLNIFKREKSKTLLTEITNQEKVSLLFLLVKIFFLPIMLNFFFNNYYSIKSQLPNLLDFSSWLTINNFNNLLFPFFLTLIFLVDTLWFSFGYAFEAGFLKNKIISVESNFFGWVVALACYPPFNGIITKYAGWYANDYAYFSSDVLTFFIRIIIVLFLFVYVGATLSLGSRCSNLTNRGIVKKGPYSIIRHPAYISKNLAWWLTIIPVFSLPAVLSMSAWSLIYHLRSITEEKHLKKDPNYVEYCKKVKYRYIPGVY